MARDRAAGFTWSRCYSETMDEIDKQVKLSIR